MTGVNADCDTVAGSRRTGIMSAKLREFGRIRETFDDAAPVHTPGSKASRPVRQSVTVRLSVQESSVKNRDIFSVVYILRDKLRREKKTSRAVGKRDLTGPQPVAPVIKTGRIGVSSEDHRIKSCSEPGVTVIRRIRIYGYGKKHGHNDREQKG
jgi:hypothetical protein